MYFLLSGEGPTDIGSAYGTATICEGDDFLVGPMTVIVEQVVKATLGDQGFAGKCGYVCKAELASRSKTLKPKQSASLPGKKRSRETGFFHMNARSLACLAKQKSQELGEDVVAVLFRDADGTASAGRGDWAKKRASMLAGFQAEGFEDGVPMIPKPKSEAWLICAWKRTPYQSCEKLEERSGNDDSPRNLKAELATLVDGEVSRESLAERVRESLDIDKIEMSSFKAFRARLEEVLARHIDPTSETRE